MTTPKNRENTFRVDFTNLPKKPTSEEVHTFVSRHLGVTRAQLVKLQISYTDDCVFVKVTDHAIAQRIVDANDNKHDYEVKGVKYKLRIRMADGGVEVRLYDLSENITDEQISRHMASYGEVLSVQDLCWSEKHVFAGCPSGIKQVKMILREPIKSYITIQGETTFVTYPKQRQTCKHCGEYMHTGISCVNNKKLLAQKLGVNDRLKRSSYAGAVISGAAGFNSSSSNNSAEASMQSFPALESTSTEAPEALPQPLPASSEPTTSGASNHDVEQVTDGRPDDRVVISDEEIGMETVSSVSDDIHEDDMGQTEHPSGRKQAAQSASKRDRAVGNSLVKPDNNDELSGKHKLELTTASDDSNGYSEVKRTRGRTKQKKTQI